MLLFLLHLLPNKTCLQYFLEKSGRKVDHWLRLEYLENAVKMVV